MSLGRVLELVSEFVAAEVTRRRASFSTEFPPPHVGGYVQNGILKQLLRIGKCDLWNFTLPGFHVCQSTGLVLQSAKNDFTFPVWPDFTEWLWCGHGNLSADFESRS